jgi:hypothetical protein
MGEALIIAGLSHPVAADYASHAARERRRRVIVIAAPQVLRWVHGDVEKHAANRSLGALSPATAYPTAKLVVFLDFREHYRQRALIIALALLAGRLHAGCVCIVSSFLVHLDDDKARRVEAFAIRHFEAAQVRVVVLRPGHVLSEHSYLSGLLSRFGAWLGAIPSRFRSCFVEGEELFRVLDELLLTSGGSRTRTYSLLGPNRPWNSLSRVPQAPALAFPVPEAFLHCLLELPFAVALGLLARHLLWCRAFHCHTLYPSTLRELLALCNPHNDRNLQIVGYNNGVTHFGHRYPGRTVVSTVCCARDARVNSHVVKLDAGTTLRAAAEALRRVGKDFHVMPNYSYVSAGTAYFVPIHGSANRYSTLGETIEKVVIYKPAKDEIICASRGDEEFDRHMYDLHGRVALLRLYVRIRDKTSYNVQRQNLESPSAQEILGHLHDTQASNVEVRKSSASSRMVEVSKYCEVRANGDASNVDVARDRLGSLWDRLEENRLTRLLFHGLTRRFAHHVELFLSQAEFAVFWETHGALPLKKIQLRYIRQDGLPNSPFRDRDCVSADLFMLKKHRVVFEDYLKATFGTVRMNPGKHSMG